jgi:DICT domain-containing protein
MSLGDIVETVKGEQRRLTLFNPAKETLAAGVREYFADQNVTVAAERTESGEPAGVVVLTRDGDPLATTTTDALARLVAETPSGEDGLGVDDSAHHDLLTHLKETTFTSHSRREMTQTSREIEDRAWREGSGRLFAGFQYESVLLGQSRTYETLGRSDLDVYAFAAPDGTDVDIDRVRVHLEEAAELAGHWFVVYDGADDRGQASALLAEERGEDSYYGFWTYDPRIVGRIVDHLERAYDPVPV